MKTAVIYARYSSERQTEQSIEGQLRVCNEYAQRNDIVIMDTYIDRAMTGTNDNRASFQKMLKDSSKRAWDYVLVYKIDRFSRNKYETAMHKKTLRDNGVKLLSAMENIPDTPEGIILESLLEGMAEYYSAELSQKVRRGMNESRQKGQYTGGYLIYGYKVVDKKLQIDEEKAEVVRYIYSEYAKEVKVKDIIRALTERGILNRGKPFAKNTIYHILENEKYSGVYHYGGQEFTNIYPRIVPEDIFNIVDTRNRNNHYGRRSVEVNYLLRKKLYCGLCGKPMSAESGTARSGEVKRYYKCLGRKEEKTNCKKSQINKDTLENFVISTTLELLQQEGIIKKIADRVFQTHNDNLSDKSLINHLLKERKRIQTQIDNFLEAIGNGISTMSTKLRLERLEEELAENEIKITSEESRARISVSPEEVMEFILTNIRKEPKQMINTLIDRIILYEDKIEIYYNYTNRKSPDGSRDFLFTQFKSKIMKPVTYTKKIMQNIQVYIYFG